MESGSCSWLPYCKSRKVCGPRPRDVFQRSWHVLCKQEAWTWEWESLVHLPPVGVTPELGAVLCPKPCLIKVVGLS